MRFVIALMLVALAVLLLLMGGCTTMRNVPVPQPVPVPGPTVYVPIPAELLTCQDTGDPPSKGRPLGELFTWAQWTRAAAEQCQARMGEIRALSDASGKSLASRHQ